MNTIIDRLRNRTNDSPLPAEYLMDEAVAEIERLTAENERLRAGRDAAIRTLADSRFPPETRVNDAIAILSRSGIVQQQTTNTKEK